MHTNLPKERIIAPFVTSMVRKLTHRRTRCITLLILFVFFASLFVIKQKKSARIEMNIVGEQKIIHYIDVESDRALSYESRSDQNKYFGSLKPVLPLRPVKMTLQTTVFLYIRENAGGRSRTVINISRRGSRDVSSAEGAGSRRASSSHAAEMSDRASSMGSTDSPAITDYQDEDAIRRSFLAQRYLIIKRAIIRKDTNTQEDTIAMQLRHPNLLLTYKTFRTKYLDRNNDVQDIVWLYSQFLMHRISHRYVNMDEHIIREILRDVLHGLAYMHSRKIMHLDIKVANIMGQRENGRMVYKLIDFGYARDLSASGRGSKLEELKIPNKSYGTFPYKPPEVVLENVHGLASDVWCVGAVAWFLSLGKIPFYNENGEKDTVMYRRFIKGTKKHFFYPETSSELRDFVLVTMHRKRTQRPSVRELLEHPFITGRKFEDDGEYDSAYESDFDSDYRSNL